MHYKYTAVTAKQIDCFRLKTTNTLEQNHYSWMTETE